MKRIAMSALALAALLAAPAVAQSGRNVPMGSPLGAVPIIPSGPGAGIPGAAASPSIDSLLRVQQAQRARAEAAYRARQAAAFDPAPTSSSATVDEGRPRADAYAAAGDADVARPQGPIPAVPFGSGITTPWARR